MKFLNSSSVDKPQAGAELGITRLLCCFAGFIVLPFRTDSTAVPPRIPVKGKGQVKKSWLMLGLPRYCTWAGHTKGSGCRQGAHCRGLGRRWSGCGTGGCSSLAVQSFSRLILKPWVGVELGFLSWEWWGCLLKRQGGAGLFFNMSRLPQVNPGVAVMSFGYCRRMPSVKMRP